MVQENVGLVNYAGEISLPMKKSVAAASMGVLVAMALFVCPLAARADEPVASIESAQETAGVAASSETEQEAPLTHDGWVETAQGHEYWKDGVRLSGAWLELDGHRYYLAADGYAVGGFQEIEGSHYYFSLDMNEMATGWKAIDGSWYWFDEATGKMAVNQALTNGRWSRFDAQGKWLGYSNGWVLDGDDWYWTSNGAPQKGWLWAGGSWYWLDPTSGKMATGWAKDSGYWYYLGPSGAMQTGWQLADGRWYFLNSGGDMRVGWFLEGGAWYWLGGSGAAAQNEVVKVGSERYVFGSSCAMVGSGWGLVNGKWNLTAPSGALRVGWQYVSGCWYWMDPTSCAMQTGLLQVGSSKYYLTDSGAMAIGWAWDGAEACWYYATPSASDGRLLTGWQKVGDAWYWMDPSSAKMQTGWLDRREGSYYLQGSGAMASSQLLDVDGERYWFGSDGTSRSGWVDTSAGRFWFDPTASSTRYPAKMGRISVDGKTYYVDLSSGVARNGWVDNGDGSKSWAGADGALAASLRDGVLTMSDGKVANGWVALSGSTFYAEPNGKLASGWHQVGGSRYYFDPSTYAMKTGWILDNGSWYWLGSNGAMATGWVYVDAWYYLNADGTMKTGWLELGGKHYWLDGSGRMATGVRYIDGYRRYFWSSGECDKIGWQNPSQYPQVSSWTVKLPSYCTGRFGYVTPSRIGVNATREDCVNAFVGRAYEYLGTPYIWDYACAPGVGVDCAGLVMQCLYATGMDTFPMTPYDHYYTPGHDHYANDLWNNSGFMHLSYAQRQRGDIICWPGHVAIYIGNDQMIEAASPALGTRLTTVYNVGNIRGVLRPFV